MAGRGGNSPKRKVGGIPLLAWPEKGVVRYEQMEVGA